MPFSIAASAGLLLLLLGTPVGVALILIPVVFLLIDPQVPLVVIPQRMLGAIDSFPLMALPFFVLVGQVMNAGGVTDRIFNFANCLIGHVRGGLAQVNILASVFMSGMSGSAVADASGLGQVEIKVMTKEGYDPSFSAAVTAASATVGPIIPPSIPLVIVGAVTGTSISQLLIAGILPGILMSVAMCLVVAWIAVRDNLPKRPRATLGQLGRSFIEALPALLAPVILIGGILFGVFTPTEASAVAAIYAIAIAMFYYKELSLRGFIEVLIETSVIVGAIFFIIAGAAASSWLFTWVGLPQTLAEWIGGSVTEPWHLLLLVNIFLLIVGCFLESNAALILVAPLLFPIMINAGIDPVHFGLVMVMNLMIGLITPPVGMNMFVVMAIARISMLQFVRAIWPFLLILIGVLMLLNYVPWFSLAIPTWAFR